ncbi:lycopene cyclase [Streptomyces oceani]|uniref:Lycopene cyclase n=1 Tax=Streptomyces oceani TaxID=1075402 RepID=A0A1E7JXS6_9ACTN|nr:lycopene cyclase [Streptomyces oceani]
MPDTDIAIIGAGAAGLSLARLLADPPPRAARHSAVLIETPHARLRPPERTWCFWDGPVGELDGRTAASWSRIRVYGPHGDAVASDIAPLRYRMIRSADYAREVDQRLTASDLTTRLAATVTDIDDHPDGAVLHCVTADGDIRSCRARWVFDTRPHPLPPARTLLLQHFRGWFLRTRRPVSDPSAAVLMDLRTRQPARGLSFGYVLPLSDHEALVEYTEFSRAALTVPQYEERLRRYVGEVLGLDEFDVRASEQGVIPMTDARFRQRVGASVFRIGAAGGATRPSTGYTFAATRRQVRAVADALFAGRTPTPPSPHSVRARAMDAVLLRALDTGRLDGAAFFERLFARNDTGQLLRFLDGGTTPLQDLRIGASTPVVPMLRAMTELPLLRRRPPPGAGP